MVLDILLDLRVFPDGKRLIVAIGKPGLAPGFLPADFERRVALRRFVFERP